MNASSPISTQRSNKFATALLLTLALISYRSILAGDMPGGAREARIQRLQTQTSFTAQ